MATVHRTVIEGNKVVIEKGGSPGNLMRVAELEFGDVAHASRVLREHLLAQMPVEVPEPEPGIRYRPLGSVPEPEPVQSNASPDMILAAYEEALADPTVPLIVYAVRFIRERARGGNHTTAYMALCEACDELKVPCPEGKASDRVVSAIATLADF